MISSIALKLLTGIDRLLMLIAMAAVAILTTMVSVGVISRYVFNSPLSGTYELTELYLIVMITFAALPRVYTLGGHVRLRVMEQHLTRLPWQLAVRLRSGVAAVTFACVSLWTFKEFGMVLFSGEKTLGLHEYPLGLSYIWIPLGSLMMAIRLAIETIWPELTTPAVVGEGPL